MNILSEHSLREFDTFTLASCKHTHKHTYIFHVENGSHSGLTKDLEGIVQSCVGTNQYQYNENVRAREHELFEGCVH